MCGICGFTGTSGENPQELLASMCDILEHRGPDSSGTYASSGRDVFLGHRRLSIIDLQTGSQPMENDRGDLVIVFNGEIYNYRSLRDQLTQDGHSFRTTSDTEVLLRLYEASGLRMLDRLDGIFAFAIYDRIHNRVFLARDHFGVKPLHYYRNGSTLVFASEIKALLLHPEVKPEIDRESLHYFLNVRYVPGSRTLFGNINRLPAGSYLVYDLKNHTVDITRYYHADRYPVATGMTEAEAVAGIRHHLQTAVIRQLVSDVPVGVYLSGGLDSSSIVAMMHEAGVRATTFSMGFNEPTDEVTDARFVADYFKTDHHETFISQDPLKHLPAAIWHIEEPKVNIMQGYFLSEFVRPKVKVVLGGLGGDELFAGYNNNRILYPLQWLHDVVPAGPGLNRASDALYRLAAATGDLRADFIRRGLQLLLSYGDKTRFYLIQRNAWDHDASFYDTMYSPVVAAAMKHHTVRSVFDRYFTDRSRAITDQSLLAELNTKLVDDFLLNEDRTSMAHGVEVRVPFLDRALVEFAFSIPLNLKLRGNHTKHIFKQAMTGILPEPILAKKKWGFAINPYHQFRKDLRTVSEKILTRERVERQGIFNYRYIRKIIDHSPSPLLRWHYFHLWMMVGFSLWHDMFISKQITGGGLTIDDFT